MTFISYIVLSGINHYSVNFEYLVNQMMDDSTIDMLPGNPFEEVMQKHSTAELIRITTLQRDDYQPEAVAAAETELLSRNLSEFEMEQAKLDAGRMDEKIKENSSIPLELWQQVLFFVFFWGIIPWGIAGTFSAKGYERKYKDAWRAMKFGFLSFTLLFLITILYLKYL